jgi:hypothetical protein
MTDYSSDPEYQQLLKQILQAGSGAGWNSTNANSTLQSQAQQFASMYQNATGQAPTSDVMSQFFQNAGQQVFNSPTGEAGANYGSDQSLFNAYLQNTYQPQIIANQKAQASNNLSDSQNQVQSLVNQTMGNTAAQFNDPNSSLYQTFAGAENNMGITPSSGAFQAGAGSTIADAGLNAANAGLQTVGLPQISGIASTANAPYQQSLAQLYPGLSSYGTGETNQYDFNQQSQLAQQLAAMSQPSTAQKDIGMAAGASQAVGGIGQGIGGASQLTWICTQMRRCNVILDTEVKQLHDHLYKAFWGRPFKFLGYLLFGKLLVWMADRVGTNWFVWKSDFYDNVMAEPDPIKAVDLYEESFWKLFRNVRSRLEKRNSYATR